VRSGINNREPLLSQTRAAALFLRVFRETMLCFPFEVRGLRIEADRISFYIKPEDGLELPAIMQRMKQVFAQRYNALTGRSGHIWGDRYWSRILEGEPPEEVSGGGGELDPYRGQTETANTGVRPRKRKLGRGPRFSANTGVRPWRRKRGRGPRFSAVSPALSASAPG
jgi:REP element-mobilizing transposase RayT